MSLGGTTPGQCARYTVAAVIAGLLSAGMVEASQAGVAPQAGLQRSARLAAERARGQRVMRTAQRRMSAMRDRQMLQALGLTAEQRQRLQELRKQRQPEMQRLAAKLRAARQAMREAQVADPPSETAIGERAAELARIQGELAVARARARQDLFSLLTPEQQQKARELRAKQLDRLRTRGKQAR
jgi:Spy/CpxP family protein refolding chaperone